MELRPDDSLIVNYETRSVLFLKREDPQALIFELTHESASEQTRAIA
jgi:hypothetical protein